MKAAPLPSVEFQGKGLLDFSSSTSTSSSSLLDHAKWNTYPKSITTTAVCKGRGKFYAGSDLSSIGIETTTTAAARSPSPSPSPVAASSSTLSSSGAGGGDGGGSTATTQDIEGNTEPRKCRMAVEDWEAVLPETGGPASPGQEQSILRLIMGDIEDPSAGLCKLLQGGGGSHHEMEFGGGFGLMDHQIQGFSFEPVSVTSASLLSCNTVEPCLQDLPLAGVHGNNNNNNNRQVNPFPLFPDSVSNSNVLPFALAPGVIQQQPQNSESLDEKPQIFHPQMITNQNQTQFPPNPSFFVPLGFNQLQEHPFSSGSPPPPKRLNSGMVGSNYVTARSILPNPGPELLSRRQLELHHAQQFQAGPAVVGMKHKVATDELADLQPQQAIVDQLYKVVELIETGNPVLAQEILARLNHQLSPIGKPFLRAAFYFKEALQLVLRTGSVNPSIPFSPFSVIYKIGAYKSFCEISPIIQFANFTCNQAFLEALEGYDRVHILSFDVGYGGEWASLMQELALRNGGPPSLKITAFASPSTHDELELGLTQENLKHFAGELNILLEFEIVNIASLNSASWQLPVNAFDGEGVAVYLPISAFASYPSYLPNAIRLLKQVSPKIVVSLDRGCDRMDTPFPNHVIHALLSHSSLLESLDAVSVNLDVLQKIERYLIQPGIEKIVMGRHRSPEKALAWRSLFLSSGFSPLTFSNFNESQAECLVQRSLVRGFHVEKRQSSLVLCWHRKELISVSTWRC